MVLTFGSLTQNYNFIFAAIALEGRKSDSDPLGSGSLSLCLVPQNRHTSGTCKYYNIFSL